MGNDLGESKSHGADSRLETAMFEKPVLLLNQLRSGLAIASNTICSTWTPTGACVHTAFIALSART